LCCLIFSYFQQLLEGFFSSPILDTHIEVLKVCYSALKEVLSDDYWDQLLELSDKYEKLKIQVFGNASLSKD